MADSVIQLMIQARDRASDAVRALRGNLGGLNATLDQTAAASGRLRSAFAANSVAVYALGQAAYQASAWVRSMAFQGLANADAAAKAADKLGINAQEYQRLAYAARLSGATMSQVEMALRTMQRELVSGSKHVAALGLDLGQLRAMRPEDQFNAIANAIAAIQDPAERSFYAMRMFGERSGVELLDMVKDLRALREEADRVGAVLEDSALKAAERFNDMLERLRITAQSKIVVAFEVIERYIADPNRPGGVSAGGMGGLAAGGAVGYAVGGVPGALAMTAAAAGIPYQGGMDVAGTGLLAGGGGVLGGMIGGKTGARIGGAAGLALDAWFRNRANQSLNGPLSVEHELTGVLRGPGRRSQPFVKPEAPRAPAGTPELDAAEAYSREMNRLAELSRRMQDFISAEVFTEAEKMGRGGVERLGMGDFEAGMKILAVEAQGRERYGKLSDQAEAEDRARLRDLSDERADLLAKLAEEEAAAARDAEEARLRAEVKAIEDAADARAQAIRDAAEREKDAREKAQAALAAAGLAPGGRGEAPTAREQRNAEREADREAREIERNQGRLADLKARGARKDAGGVWRDKWGRPIGAKGRALLEADALANEAGWQADVLAGEKLKQEQDKGAVAGLEAQIAALDDPAADAAASLDSLRTALAGVEGQIASLSGALPDAFPPEGVGGIGDKGLNLLGAIVSNTAAIAAKLGPGGLD